MDSSERSETWLVVRLIGLVLFTPIVLVLVLFGRRSFSDVFEPFRLVFRWLFEAPLTLAVAVLLASVFVLQLFVIDTAAFVAGPQSLSAPWTLLTSGFVHGSVPHLLWNLFALLVFGRVVESSYGAARWLVVFCTAIIAGSLLHIGVGVLSADPAGVLGASGGISGLVAAAMLANPLRITFAQIIPMPIAAAASFYIITDTLGLIGGVSDGVSYAAHVGGLLTGALVSMSVAQNRTLGLVCVGVFVVLILALGLV